MSDPSLSRAVTIAGLLALAAGPALGAEESHRCASVANDQARLACYDAAFGKPAAGSASATAATAAAQAAPASGAASARPPTTEEAAAKAREEFGLSEIDKRARNPEQDVSPQSIAGQVVKIGYRPTGEMVVSLADGQVWTQIESDVRSRLKVGDDITIRKATLGSYMLVGPDRIAVRVRRLK